MKINPAYTRAAYELALVLENGETVSDAWPLRFRKKDIKLAMKLMAAHRWEDLRALAIPPFK